MAVTTQIDSNVTVAGTKLAIDPTFKAARATLYPTDYYNGSTVLGHFGACQLSGAIAGSGNPAAGDVHASLRWTSAAAYLVLLRLKLGFAVTGAITTATQMSYRAFLARGFTVNFSSNQTSLSMTGVTNTGKMRNTMGASLLGTVGPTICTTAAMTGQTYTLDTAAFANAVFDLSAIVTGTVSVPAAIAGEMQTLYECTASGQHPIILSANEGIAIKLANTGPTDGSWCIYTMWEWLEVTSF